MSGLKYDGGKLRWDLLPLHLVEKVVEVYTFGAQKYADNSWQNLDNGYNRYKAALFRHLTAHEKGEAIDPESGLMHLAHVAWNAIALMHFGAEPPTESSPNPLPSSTFAFPIGAPVSLVGHPETHDFITKRDTTSKGNIYFTPNFGWCYEKDIEHYPPQKQPTP